MIKPSSKLLRSNYHISSAQRESNKFIQSGVNKQILFPVFVALFSIQPLSVLSSLQGF